jgi:hypothetical protein
MDSQNALIDAQLKGDKSNGCYRNPLKNSRSAVDLAGNSSRSCRMTGSVGQSPGGEISPIHWSGEGGVGFCHGMCPYERSNAFGQRVPADSRVSVASMTILMPLSISESMFFRAQAVSVRTT